ncbi:MAG: hypothetical protein JOZ08_14695 [Verrucomicrobia bacterium]|nr:hypothetical protein [Verrucomicrobiota bacterium]
MKHLRFASSASIFGLVLGLALLPVSLLAAGDDPIVGRWSGQVTEQNASESAKYPMTIQFDSPSHGSTDYSPLECSGELNGGRSAGGTYSYTEKIKNGDCIDGGHLEVKLINQNTISILWSIQPGDKSDTVSGTLTRQ